MLMTFCVKCRQEEKHFCEGSMHAGPFECAWCGYMWTVKAGRQIPEPNKIHLVAPQRDERGEDRQCGQKATIKREHHGKET